jgi:hypothetical protein
MISTCLYLSLQLLILIVHKSVSDPKTNDFHRTELELRNEMLVTFIDEETQTTYLFPAKVRAISVINCSFSHFSCWHLRNFFL